MKNFTLELQKLFLATFRRFLGVSVHIETTSIMYAMDSDSISRNYFISQLVFHCGEHLW